ILLLPRLAPTAIYTHTLHDALPIYDHLTPKIDVRQTRNTSLIEIRVYSNSKDKPAQEAADIANEIADVYRKTRLELKKDMSLKRSEEHTSELQSRVDLVCRLLLEKQ